MKTIREIRFFPVILVILIFLNVLSCSRDIQDEDAVIVATVNEEELTDCSFREFSLIDSTAELSDTKKREMLDDLIKLTVLAQEADKRGITQHSGIRERIRIAEKKIKANALLAQMFHDLEVTESEVFNYYQIHKSRYTGERDEYSVQRIFLENEAMADSVSALIVEDNEINFTEAARSYSQDQTGEDGGYLGYMTADEMEPAVWNSLRNLSQWRFARIPVSNGFYLIRYTDKRSRATERPFTEVADLVREELLEERRKDMVNGLVEELVSKSEIVISR